MSSNPKNDNHPLADAHAETIGDLEFATTSFGEATFYPHDLTEDYMTAEQFASFDKKERPHQLKRTLIKVGAEISFTQDEIAKIDEHVNTATKREDNPHWQDYLKQRDKLVKQRQLLDQKLEDGKTLFGKLKAIEEDFWEEDDEGSLWIAQENVAPHEKLFDQIVNLQNKLKESRAQRREYIKREGQLLTDYENKIAEERFEKRKEAGELLTKLTELNAVYNHSATEIAECAGVHPRTMREYLNGKRDLPMDAFKRLEKLGPGYADLVQDIKHSVFKRKAWSQWEPTFRMLVADNEKRSMYGLAHGKPMLGDEEGPFDLTRGQCPECGSGQDTTDEDPHAEYGTKVTRTKTNTVVGNEETGALGMEYAAKGLPQDDVLVARERTCLNPDCAHRWWTYEVDAKTLDDVYMNAHKYEAVSKNIANANAVKDEDGNVVQLGLFGNLNDSLDGIAGLLANSSTLLSGSSFVTLTPKPEHSSQAKGTTLIEEVKDLEKQSEAVTGVKPEKPDDLIDGKARAKRKESLEIQLESLKEYLDNGKLSETLYKEKATEILEKLGIG